MILISAFWPLRSPKNCSWWTVGLTDPLIQNGNCIVALRQIKIKWLLCPQTNSLWRHILRLQGQLPPHSALKNALNVTICTLCLRYYTYIYCYFYRVPGSITNFFSASDLERIPCKVFCISYTRFHLLVRMRHRCSDEPCVRLCWCIVVLMRERERHSRSCLWRRYRRRTILSANMTGWPHITYPERLWRVLSLQVATHSWDIYTSFLSIILQLTLRWPLFCIDMSGTRQCIHPPWHNLLSKHMWKIFFH